MHIFFSKLVMMLLKVAERSSVRGMAKNLHDLLTYFIKPTQLLYLAATWSHWDKHVLGWWKHKDDANVFFLKYEDLKKVCYHYRRITGKLVFSFFEINSVTLTWFALINA